jgi:aspartyl-tRNA(Asn)/glutamyl-tRNA(Gln) amidotransferase subunit C
MALTKNDIEKLAKLSRLSLTDDEMSQTMADLNNIFTMVEKMQALNTDGVEPMSHPHELALRLREDAITEVDQHEYYQQIAPAVSDDLYLVPKVIE